MEKERFLKMFEYEKVQLPIKSHDKDVYEILEERFTEYIKLLKTNNLETIQINKVNNKCDLILQAIKDYYKGSPVNAYKSVEALMNEMKNTNSLVFYQKNDYFGKFYKRADPLNLYRVRKIKEEKLYEKKDIFHIPFSQRRKVSSSRFSIAGYPSLYLGTSHDLCRIESGIGKQDNYIISKFKINRNFLDTNTNISVLDLAIKPKELKNFNDSNGIYRIEDETFRDSYIETYPIITACSIMVEKKDDKFHPEYIIPQLLMQWLTKTSGKEGNFKALFGIRYFSCRAKNPKIEGFNYVFPVVECNMSNPKDEYCPVLSKAFYLTEPIHSKDENIDSLLDNKKLSKIN